MAARRNGTGADPTWKVEVTGPCCDGKAFPNIGSGLAFAMHQAGVCDTDGAWYVREPGVTLIVEKQNDGSIAYYERRAA